MANWVHFMNCSYTTNPLNVCSEKTEQVSDKIEHLRRCSQILFEALQNNQCSVKIQSEILTIFQGIAIISGRPKSLRRDNSIASNVEEYTTIHQLKI